LCLIGFSGFFDTHLEMNIQKSKTDIYRRGNKVVIAKTGRIKSSPFFP
jgi:hypothetical protein